ncbi:MAG TPA: SRPBCC domain-containing protein [bacterium]|nr:SRPBCC domain-containing protein [bacterium]
MTFAYTIPFARPADAAWDALADTERLIRCIPGCEAVEPAAGDAAGGPGREPVPAGAETYSVRVATGLGPVRLRAAGIAAVRRDPSARSVTAKVSLADPRAGAMYATMTLEVRPAADGRSELRLAADVVLASKMGEFAQPLLRHKADQTVRQFVQNLTEALDARG